MWLIVALLVCIMLVGMYIASRLTDIVRLMAAWIATDRDKAEEVYKYFKE